MSLYEWRNVDTEAWDDLPAVHDTLVADGVLVPVEPDKEVEAIEVPAYEYYDGARAQVGVLYEVRATVLYPGRYAIVAVDAALGIGETP